MILPKLTAIGSGKGGTGKTFVATMLAAALAERGERVLLCDADLGLSNSTVHLGLQSGGDLVGVLLERAELAEAVVPVMGGASARGGFDLIAAPPGSGTLANIDRSIAERLISRLAAARAYDHVLLDLSAGVDAATIEFAAQADRSLLVLTPDPAALADAYAFVKLLLRCGGKTPLALVNMAESAAEARRTFDALANTCRAFLKTSPEYLGFIARDHHVAAAIRRQQPLIAVFPKAPAAQALGRIAAMLGTETKRPQRPAVALSLH